MSSKKIIYQKSCGCNKHNSNRYSVSPQKKHSKKQSKKIIKVYKYKPKCPVLKNNEVNIFLSKHEATKYKNCEIEFEKCPSFKKNSKKQSKCCNCKKICISCAHNKKHNIYRKYSPCSSSSSSSSSSPCSNSSSSSCPNSCSSSNSCSDSSSSDYCSYSSSSYSSSSCSESTSSCSSSSSSSSSSNNNCKPHKCHKPRPRCTIPINKKPHYRPCNNFC